MKLTATRVRQTLDQFEAQPIPNNHPAVPELNRLFGEHTFFVNDDGLHVVEPVERSAGGTEEAKVVKLATWNDEEKTHLAPHAPEPTDIVVVLPSEGDTGAED